MFISELTKLEFSSTLWKKVRTKEITELQAKQTISIFNSDLPKYHIVRIDSEVIKAAINLIAKYGNAGFIRRYLLHLFPQNLQRRSLRYPAAIGQSDQHGQ